MRIRRSIQAICFMLFLMFLWYAAVGFDSRIPVDLFVRMDPLVGLSIMIGTREFMSTLVPFLVVLALTLVFGRFFCFMVCPLGACIDAARSIVRGALHGGENSALQGSRYKPVKYLVLIFILSGALLKVSTVAYGAPMPIVTRLFGLIVYPVLTLMADAGLNVLRPLAARFDVPFLVYADLPNPAFRLQWLIVILPCAIFALTLKAPRFWCRYLCPSGAIFALFAWRPIFMRRRVSDRCTACGLCSRGCPMDAIGEDPHATDFSECIGCRKCSGICPEGAVRFSGRISAMSKRVVDFSMHRRALLAAALAGFATALTARASLPSRVCGGGTGAAGAPALIRPPGAVPEGPFLDRCVGCGQCMKACPTNTLQPAGLEEGLAGIFSPVLVPRRGPCDPACNACGLVCPTRAIRPLSIEEKRYAKIGTAVILREQCIAWEQGKACLICDEVCPYGAVGLKRIEGAEAAVPFVEENRCNGCGFCEYYCPVQASAAIRVEPTDALRIMDGSYREEGRDLGISIEPKQGGAKGPEGPGMPEGSLPPGFTE